MKMSGTQVRAEFADVLNRVIQGQETVAVTRYGKAEAYILSAEQYERLTRDLMKD